MNDPTPTSENVPRPVPAYIAGPPPRHSWAGALIAACLALGLALGWGKYEVRLRGQDEANLSIHRRNLDWVLSRDGDLGRLLADPRTRMIPLQSDRNLLREATIAWNDDRQRGVLFCDSLAPAAKGLGYQIWLVPSDGSADAQAVGLADAQPGQSVYPFSPVGRVSPRQFVLTFGRPALLLSQAGSQVARASLE